MNVVLLTAAGITVLVAGAFVWIFRRIVTPVRHATPGLGWLHEFSIEKYRPMQRLLTREDYEFLRSQPGFTPTVAKMLQARRRRVLRLYLADLGRDFENVYALAKLCLVHSAEDRPGLALALLRQKWTFRYAMGLAHLRLMLQPVGLSRVDTRALVDAVDAMYRQLRQSNVVLLTCRLSG